MDWILYVILGIFILGFLSEAGVITEFFGMVIMTLIVAVITGGIGAIFGAKFGSGFDVGVFIGLGIYALYCIIRIFDPEVTIEFREDGSKNRVSSRVQGIIGLVVLLIVIGYAIYENVCF